MRSEIQPLQRYLPYNPGWGETGHRWRLSAWKTNALLKGFHEFFMCICIRLVHLSKHVFYVWGPVLIKWIVYAIGILFGIPSLICKLVGHCTSPSWRGDFSNSKFRLWVVTRLVPGGKAMKSAFDCKVVPSFGVEGMPNKRFCTVWCHLRTTAILQNMC